MPQQNRVTPFGEIIATPARGALMGNRGSLHDATGRIRRPFQTQRWIICVLEFKGRRRRIMTPGQYTELFFLDEATALAAGHRPCAECSRPRYIRFRDLWAAANAELAGGPAPSAPTIDAVLHRERWSAQGAKLTYWAPLTDLPPGVFVVHPITQQAHLWWADRLWPWEPAGYGSPCTFAVEEVVSVLTPRSIVRTLAAGFPVMSALGHSVNG